MKNYSSIIMASLLVLGGLSSCSNNEGTRPGIYDDIVTFQASNNAMTRVTGVTWDAGDAIGIYMDAAQEATNRKYTTGGGTDGKFTPANVGTDGIKFPESGTADFYAYYPYTSSATTAFEVPVNIADQTKDLDLMYAVSAAVANADSPVALTFDRKMTKVTFNLEDEASIGLTGMVATFKGLNTTATLDLKTGDITGEGGVADFTGVTSGTTVTAIVIPTTSTTGFSVNFKNSNVDVDYNFTDGTALNDATHYSFNVKFNADGQISVSSSINDWTDVNGGDIVIPVEPGDGGGGEGGVIFKETFGNGDYPSSNRPKIADFTDWDEKGVTYSDASGNTDIRSTGSTTAHAWLPKDGDAYLTIAGINTAGYEDITLSFDLAANTYDVTGTTVLSDMITVSWNGTALTLPTINLTDNDQSFKTFEITTGITAVASGTLEFFASSTANTLGLRLDNITITADGDDPGPGPGPGPGDGDYYEAGTLASWNFTTLATTLGWENDGNSYNNSGNIPNNGASDMITGSANITPKGNTTDGGTYFCYTTADNGVIVNRGMVTSDLEGSGWLFTIPLDKEIAAGTSVAITFSARASGTGPAEHVCEISTDNNTWTAVDTYEVVNSIAAKTMTPYTFNSDVTSSELMIRLRPRSDVSVGGATFGTGGTFRIAAPTVVLQ